MPPSKTHKKPYTIIIDREKREEIVLFAQKHTWKQALQKYQISIATLKRWSANYNSSDPKRSLNWHYGHERREDKYFDQCVVIRRFMYDHYKNNGDKYGMRGWTKAQLVHYVHGMIPHVHISTVYRLVKYVEAHRGHSTFYL